MRPSRSWARTILTAGPQGTIEKGTILVKDGKIADVGADVELPSGLPVINATGQYVMPGIIDAHSHTAVEGTSTSARMPSPPRSASAT